MTILQQDIQDPDGTFVKRIELERVSASEIRYREYDPPDLDDPVKDREATEEEARPLVTRERDRQSQKLRARAEDAISTLETVGDTSVTLTNDQLSDAVRLIARVLAAILRVLLRKLG